MTYTVEQLTVGGYDVLLNRYLIGGPVRVVEWEGLSDQGQIDLHEEADPVTGLLRSRRTTTPSDRVWLRWNG